MARGQLPDIEVDTVSAPPEPVGKGRRRSQFYTEVAVKARKNPAEWVVLRGYRSSAVSSQMKAGKYPAINPEDYEIEVRRNDDGERYDLYIKYVGKVVEES